MRTIILMLALATTVEAQRKQELFREYVSSNAVLFEAKIPTETCRAIITQAGDILADSRLKTVNPKDLRIASLNLRVCATTDSLTRMDRDWAVGLHAEFVSELEHQNHRNFNHAGR